MYSGVKLSLPKLPPLATLSVSLAQVTELFAKELVAPSLRAPNWSNFEWRIARAVAVMQGICSILRSKQVWGCAADWQRFLETQDVHIAKRHQRITALLGAIDSKARRDGIALLGLKGVALHALGIYRPGERPMADIDLLVCEPDMRTATALLEECGYRVTYTTWRHCVLESLTNRQPVASSFGEHADNPVKIELHSAVKERLPINETDITPFLFPSFVRPGLSPYRSIVALMMHLLLHASGNMRAHALRFIQLIDIARLASRFTARDWDELVGAEIRGRRLWWAVPPLILTARYFRDTVPRTVLSSLRRHCSWWLLRSAQRNTLTHVSWSNVRAYALPGIEWSKTPSEAMRFAFGRVLPAAETSLDLARYSTRQPGGSDIPWYGISHGARILRWVFSTPPRVQTLLSIRAALAQSD